MKKIMYKTMTMVLALSCIYVGAAAINVEAEGGRLIYEKVTVKGINYGAYYNTKKKTATIEPLKTLRGNYNVPETIKSSKGVVYKVNLISFNSNRAKIKKLTLSKNIEFVSGSISQCKSLKAIKTDKRNPYLVAENGAIYNKKKTVIKAVVPMAKGVFSVPKTVKEIDWGAFQNCKALTSVSIPGSVKKIDREAFLNSSLKTVTIPSTVNEIGDMAFRGCKSLTSIVISEGVTSMGSSAFLDCTSLVSVSIPGSMKEIGVGAFSGCKSLTGIVLSEGVKEIGSGAFLDCTSLTGVTIPESVTSIGDYAFEGCKSLTTVNVSGSVKEIGGEAFVGCENLKNITVPKGKKEYFENLLKKEGVKGISVVEAAN